MTNIGFVGLGTMGTPMVLNLLKHGLPVKVYSAHMGSSNVKLALSHGATAAKSPREVAAGSDIIMMCLPRADITESVVFGRRGILAGAAPGSIIVEMSTVPPTTVLKIGRSAMRKKVKVLDAPISGGRVGAELGTLTIIVGGDKEDFDRCRDVFEKVGKNIYHVGGLGAGETIKLINSLIGNANLFAAIEGLELAAKAKIDLRLLQKIISTSTGQSWTWNTLVPRMIDSVNVGVTFDVLLKDVTYALALAGDVSSDARIAKEISSILSGLKKSRGGTTDVSSAFPLIMDAGKKKEEEEKGRA